MKKTCCFLALLQVFLLLSGCSTEKNTKPITKVQAVSGFAAESMPDTRRISPEDYASFCEIADYEKVPCPYSDLFGIQAAFTEKAGRDFTAKTHSRDFFAGTKTVDADALYKTVAENNHAFMTESSDRFFYKELSEKDLRYCCTIVANALNWGMANTEGVDLANLGCILGNLKILDKTSANYGEFDDDDDILSLTLNLLKSKNADTTFELTVIHEAMHIMQCRCMDIPKDKGDSFIGTSFSFANLAINPLKNSWLYEASAELNTAQNQNTLPTLYRTMIQSLESISLATILKDSTKVRQLEKSGFTQSVEDVYAQLAFENREKAAAFLYAAELFLTAPDDFKAIYEKKYGAIEGGYSAFLQKTYLPYFHEVVAKMFYKNLAAKLAESEISLTDIFYLVSLYETDLLNAIPLDNPPVRETHISLYTAYKDLQEAFFALLQKYTDVPITDTFRNYRMHYENGALYANAALRFLDAEKQAYLLERDNALYDKYHKHLIFT